MKNNNNNEFDHLWKKLPPAIAYKNLITLFNSSIPSWLNFFSANSDVLIAKEVINHLQNGYPYGKIKVTLTGDVKDLYLYLLNIKYSKTFAEPTGEIYRKLNYAIEQMRGYSMKYFSYNLDDDDNISKTFSEQLEILAVEQKTYFIRLVTGNNVEKIKKCLLNKEVNINELCEGGTPLHYAIAYRHVEAAKILIEHGADVTIKDSEGTTCIDASSEMGDDILEEIVGSKNRLKLI